MSPKTKRLVTYIAFGFVETGEMDGEELIAILKL